MSPLIGRIVTGGMATLAELNSIYSLEDAYKLDEILTLKHYHEWLGAKQSK